MERKHIYLIFIVLCLVLAVVFSMVILSPGGRLTTGAVANVSAETASLEIVQQDVASLRQQQDGLRSLVAQIQQQLTTIETSTATLQQELATVSANVQNMQAQQEQLRAQLQGQGTQLSTGLAGLQQNVEITKAELTQTDVSIQTEQNKTQTLIYIVLGFLLLVAIGGAFYYFLEIKNQTNGGKLKPEIVNYMTHHIKQGFKYPQIRENLLKAGWDEEEIKWAYQETARHNYQEYSKKKRLPSDQRKIAAIGAVTVFLILGILLIMRGTSTGQAYNYYGEVADYEETLPLNPALTRCYPPEILFNNACCDDINNNTICDDTEGYTENVSVASLSCASNADCSGLRQCVNNECRFIAELYNTGQCAVKCNLIRVHLTTYHASGNNRVVQNYTLRPGLGSYTGAGALAWTIVPVPDYCQVPPDHVIVPLKIERFSNSQLLSTEIIAMEPNGERILNHPLVNLQNFTIKVDSIFHTCGASTFG